MAEQLDETNTKSREAYRHNASIEKAVHDLTAGRSGKVSPEDRARSRKISAKRERGMATSRRLDDKTNMAERLDELHGKGSLEKTRDYWDKKREQKENKRNAAAWALSPRTMALRTSRRMRAKRGNNPKTYDDEDKRIFKLSTAKGDRAEELIRHRDEAKTYKRNAKKLRKATRKHMEETMDPIQEGIQSIQDNNLEGMRNSFNDALSRKAAEALQEKKLEIASSYFGK